MGEEPSLRVHCYSGYKADERPVWFEWLGVRRDVEAILDRWYGPDHMYFKVRTSDGAVYLLSHNEHDDRWDIQALQR